MTNEQLIKTYTTDILDLIYNFNPAWKYLDEEKQQVINAFKQGLLELIKQATEKTANDL